MLPLLSPLLSSPLVHGGAAGLLLYLLVAEPGRLAVPLD
jgi:hypothetical protein